MNFKNLFVLIIIFILFLIVIELTRLNTRKKCPQPIIEYRYVPRSFKDEQEQPVSIEDIFGIMFSKPSPWMISRGINETGRQQLINTGFIGREMIVDKNKFGERPKKI
jgi:hypothetical protein